MVDTARAYFDTVLGFAGEPAQRARDLAERVRQDLRAGAERLRSDVRGGAEQIRSHGGRTVTDIGRLVRAEVDATLSRLGVATQADFDDLNLRLEHSEEEIRELRMRLEDAEARAARTPAPVTAEPAPAPAETTDASSDEEQA